MIALLVYALGLGCIALGARHRVQAWAFLHMTRRRVALLITPFTSPRDAMTTLEDLSRALRSGMTLRASLVDDAERPGSILPTVAVNRLARGDVLRDVCRDELAAVDARVVRAIELADLSGSNAAEVLDVAARAIRQDHDLELLARSAGSHARSTVTVLTGCSLGALAVSSLLSSSVRSLLTTYGGLVLVAIGIGCNVGARAWIARESKRSLHRDASSNHVRDVILTLESLVLAGYSLQGALMTAHTWLKGTSSELRNVAERLHRGHTVDAALLALENSGGGEFRTVVHGLRLAHHDGGPVHTSLAMMRDEVTNREAHRLTTQIQRTPVRLVIPLVACALPSFLCIGVIPVFVAILGGLTATQGV